MREICTSGSVRDGGGNVPIYSASLVPDRREMAQEAAPIDEVGMSPEESELPCLVQLDQPGQEQAAEELAQHADREQEGGS